MPGQVDGPAAFWDLVMSRGTPSTARVPTRCFNIDAFQHPNNERPGSFNVPGGYFLDEDPADFDPTFFNISPIEAAWLDPQQRKVLETVYEAFENSGTPLEKVAGTRTGVYVGSFVCDSQQMAFRGGDFRHSYSATGIDHGILANRVNNIFDLHGPRYIVSSMPVSMWLIAC
jgi:acyl transferase domain-containing protein